jgi:hypothetical protein
MSNTTLHPALQNFLVDINDECANPGTMWASVISWGNHGMLRLHVCVDVITLPFGILMLIGLVARRLLVTGAFSTRKWPVAPESDMACCTDLVTFALSKIVAALGSSCRLFACTIICHTLLRVGMVGVGGLLISFVGGMYSSSAAESSSLVNSSVAAVLLSSHFSSTLLMHTVSSSAKSWLMLLIGVGYSSG